MYTSMTKQVYGEVEQLLAFQVRDSAHTFNAWYRNVQYSLLSFIVRTLGEREKSTAPTVCTFATEYILSSPFIMRTLGEREKSTAPTADLCIFATE